MTLMVSDRLRDASGEYEDTARDLATAEASLALWDTRAGKTPEDRRTVEKLGQRVAYGRSRLQTLQARITAQIAELNSEARQAEREVHWATLERIMQTEPEAQQAFAIQLDRWFKTGIGILRDKVAHGRETYGAFVNACSGLSEGSPGVAQQIQVIAQFLTAFTGSDIHALAAGLLQIIETVERPNGVHLMTGGLTINPGSEPTFADAVRTNAAQVRMRISGLLAINGREVPT